MGEDEFDIKTGAMYYRDEQGELYKLLLPITEATVLEATPSVDDVNVFIPPTSAGEITMNGNTASELYWNIIHGCERMALAGYMYVRGGTDRRRIKRHKRRIRMFKIKQKIAESRGQIQK